LVNAWGKFGLTGTSVWVLGWLSLGKMLVKFGYIGGPVWVIGGKNNPIWGVSLLLGWGKPPVVVGVVGILYQKWGEMGEIVFFGILVFYKQLIWMKFMFC